MTDRATLDHLRSLEPHLRAHILGQDHVLPRIAAGFCRAVLGLTAPERPAASFLFVGPTGTGKSETFACASDYVFGPGRLVTFDLSEYQDRSAVNKMLGEGRDDPGLFGRALATMSSGALLFDEIEKAHPLILDLFLQILWRGRITVATGDSFSMANYIIGFTSNIGAAEAMRMERSTFATIEQATLRRIDQALRPELVGRIDEKLVFDRLSPDVQRAICVLEVERELTRLRACGFDLKISSEGMEFLIREGFHPALGARPLRKIVERQLQNAVVADLFAAGTGKGTLRSSPAERRLTIRSRESGDR